MQFKQLGFALCATLAMACTGGSDNAPATDDASITESDGGAVPDAAAPDTGSASEDAATMDEDASTMEVEVVPVFPDEPVTKQYWMRTAMGASATMGSESASITFVSYSLVTVTRDATDYAMVDLQCQVDTENGACASDVCATITAEQFEARSFAPSRRTLTFDGKAWTSSACAQAVGWKWSCTDGPEGAEVPTTEADPLVYNPGEGDPADVLPGADIKIIFDGPTFDQPEWCITEAAQKIDVIYSGEVVSGGELALSGSVVDNGSVQNLLNDYCGTFATPTPDAPGTLQLVERTFDGGGDVSMWTCPSLEDFRTAFVEG